MNSRVVDSQTVRARDRDEISEPCYLIFSGKMSPGTLGSNVSIRVDGQRGGKARIDKAQRSPMERGESNATDLSSGADHSWPCKVVVLSRPGWEGGLVRTPEKGREKLGE